ncbi:hypothetical protein [Pseudonocardia sp. 73-21]|uniref:hypothetical protein n=1 Tax=Pseudonocardia sp. 73-21 TaxID=1895809 RepID=UPI000969607D|nr:hypothetical protein [Pseudonocardia sp. 73-21]OJY47598.1 MAG: hypothetical protein BGP03_33235 [Pseudonocardia sp. 73-21]
MSEVWITHPGLTPAHDRKVLRAALGTYAASGWQVRDDQTEPTPAELAAAELAAAEAAAEQPATDQSHDDTPEVVPEPGDKAVTANPTTPTTKKDR